jgi:quercetin dioxygenase-like cupin family protein
MIYWAALYKDLDHKKIADDVRKEGFNPLLINDPPGFIYSLHSHPETKLLVFLEGSMEVRVKGKLYQCEVGDKLIIPGNFEHSAKAGPEGCTFFWSEKL